MKQNQQQQTTYQSNHQATSIQGAVWNGQVAAAEMQNYDMPTLCNYTRGEFKVYLGIIGVSDLAKYQTVK